MRAHHTLFGLGGATALLVGWISPLDRSLAPGRGTGTLDDAFTIIAAGTSHTCALTATGTAFCWGGNGYGQLGAVTSESCKHKDGNGRNMVVSCATRPTRVAGDVRFASLALGNLHTCALTPEGVAYCWGDNTYGQLGVESVSDTCVEPGRSLPCSRVPIPVAGGLRFARITAGGWYTCGLLLDGTVRCWGSNQHNELGTAEPLENCTRDIPGLTPWMCVRKPALVASDQRAITIASGAAHTCALGNDSTAYCWGYRFVATPKPIAGGQHFSTLAAGGEMTCGLIVDGVPYCWGMFDYPFGGIRMGTTTPDRGGTWPEKMADHHFAMVTVGGAHICGLAASGQAFCWGRGTEGQLGTKQRLGPLLSKERWTSEPVIADGNVRFSTLAAGSAHTCGIATDGRAHCWGANFEGQLGDGTTSQRNTPTPVRTENVALTAGNLPPITKPVD